MPHYRGCARVVVDRNPRGQTVRLRTLVIVTCVTATISGLVHETTAAAAPLPSAWCGTDEVATDRPDLVAERQMHVIYAYPSDSPDRFTAVARDIIRDLAGVDSWWRSQDPTRTPRFDLATFPNCDNEFGALDKPLLLC